PATESAGRERRASRYRRFPSCPHRKDRCPVGSRRAVQKRGLVAGFQWLALTCWLIALDTMDRAWVAISAVSFIGIDACGIPRYFPFSHLSGISAKNQCIWALTFVP